MGKEYIRYAEKSLANQNMVSSDTDILALALNNPTTEYYTSLYTYSQEKYDEYKRTGSAAGMSGSLTNQLVYDFDSESDIKLAQDDTKTMYNRLLSYGLNENDIQVYYSGNKGHHLIINSATWLDKETAKALAYNTGGDLKTFDTKVYDEQRLFRVPLSYNKKSGLYKIPLYKHELFESTIDEIKQYANKEWVNVDESLKLIKSWSLKVHLPESLTKLAIKKETKKIEITLDDVPDFTNKRKEITEAKYALEMGFFEPGERNEAYLILAATYRYLAYAKDHAHNMIKATDRLHVQRCLANGIKRQVKPKEEIWTQVIEPVYSPNWKGGTFSELENPLLIKTKQRYNIKENLLNINPIVMADLGGENFTKYAQSFYESRILTGLKDLDDKMPICAGANVGIVGASGSGKTSITLEILKNMGNTEAISVFASLDMSRSRIFEKLLYKVTDGKLNRDELYQEYINGNGKKYDEMVKQMFPNVFIYSKSSPSIEEMNYYIKAVEDKKGLPVRLLMIDYFERVGSQKSDDTAASKDVSSGIQDLISDFPMLTPITLLQPNKFSISGGTHMPITSMTSIKGSSFVFQSLRNIISIWRPFSSPEMSKQGLDKFLEVAILKNDLGECDMFKYDWKGKTGTISPLLKEGERMYNDYMEIKKQLENAKYGNAADDI